MRARSALHGLRRRPGREARSLRVRSLSSERRRSSEPARDKLTVRLPRETKRIVQPPTAEQVAAVISASRVDTGFRPPPKFPLVAHGFRGMHRHRAVVVDLNDEAAPSPAEEPPQ